MGINTSSVHLTLNTRSRFQLSGVNGKEALRRVVNLLQASLGGAGPNVSDWFLSVDADSRSSLASGATILSSASGTITNIIGGRTVSVVAAGGDTNTALLLANAINASAAANVFAGATRYVGTFSCADVIVPGETVVISGFTFTAVATSDERRSEFDFIGGVGASDDLDSLISTINNAPSLKARLVASPDVGDPTLGYIGTIGNVPATSADIIISNAQDLTVGQIIARPICMTYAKTPGRIGSAVSYIVSGTGTTNSTDTVEHLISGEGSLDPLLTSASK